MITIFRMSSRSSKWLPKEEFIIKELEKYQSFWLLSLAVVTYWRYAIFNAIYPKLCYLLCHIPRSSAIFFLNVMQQYIALTPSYANSSYAMFSGQSRGRISGYCCTYSILCLADAINPMWYTYQAKVHEDNKIMSSKLPYYPR